MTRRTWLSDSPAIDRKPGTGKNEATVGPDQGLERGGLPDPVRFRWDIFQLRAQTWRGLVTEIVVALMPERAAGEMDPPGRRGSVPSSV